MENQRNQQGEMVDNQTENKTNKHLKKRKKKFPIQEQYNFGLSSSGVTPLASSPVYLCLPGRFGTGIWQCWSPPIFSV
jgi:hypothetical protein